MGDMPTTDFQAFLMDAYAKYTERTKRWRPSLSEFARYLGVSAASMDHWLMGNRTPDLQNAIKLSEKLGPKVFELLGFPTLARISDPKLYLLIDSWEVLDNDTRAEILSICERFGGGAK